MDTPSSHSKNSATKICSKGWVAHKPLFDRWFDGGAKMFQGLCPKRRESWIANWVYSAEGGTADGGAEDYSWFPSHPPFAECRVSIISTRG